MCGRRETIETSIIVVLLLSVDRLSSRIDCKEGSLQEAKFSYLGRSGGIQGMGGGDLDP